MEKSISKLTVFFEDPFWVGIFEREHEGKYEACKVTFGAEPKDYEVYAFTLKVFSKLRFSPSLAALTGLQKRINPKRMRREINKQLLSPGIGTKAQQALKLQQEQVKLDRKVNFRLKREVEKERQFQLHLEKCKEKHRGH